MIRIHKVTSTYIINGILPSLRKQTKKGQDSLPLLLLFVWQLAQSCFCNLILKPTFFLKKKFHMPAFSPSSYHPYKDTTWCNAHYCNTATNLWMPSSWRNWIGTHNSIPALNAGFWQCGNWTKSSEIHSKTRGQKGRKFFFSIPIRSQYPP